MAWIPIAAAAMSYLGQQDTNDTNMEIAQANSAFNANQAGLSREFNASEARMQRDWSSDQADKSRAYMTEMSGTAYQRAIKDMMSAGLNPMLAYSQGGASTPSSSAPAGAAASGPSASAAANPVIGNKNLAAISGAQSYLQSEQMKAQISNIEAQTDLTRAQIPRTEQETRTGQAMESNLRKETDLKDEQINKVRHEVDLLIREFRLKGVQIIKLEKEIENIMEEKFRIGAETKRLGATTDNLEIENIIKQYGIPAAKNAAAYEESTWGGARPYLKDAATAVGTAARGALLRGR